VKFDGELKFPEIDHPGVPVQFVIEGSQAEIVVEGESLGRWSLYDIHARRLVASAFQIDLEGTEVTFVAADPIDFAYRGVEHMAEVWATMKSKRMATRSLAVRKSRKDIIPSRIDDLREAMESNLQALAPRPIAGEPSMPGRRSISFGQDRPPEPIEDPQETSMASVTGAPEVVVPREPDASALLAQQRELDQERQRLAEERAQIERERKEAVQREANLLEAYRLEMERLEAERAELQRQKEAQADESEAAERIAAAERQAAAEIAALAAAERVAREAAEQAAAQQAERAAREAEEREAAERAAREAEEREAAERAAREAEEREAAERAEQEAREAEEREADKQAAAAAANGSADGKVVDLSEIEEAGPGAASPGKPKAPEPALAGAPKEKSGGLMGAVKAAFRSGAKDHTHSFVEAPGGIGITRYVCEECGYVSISVGS